MLNAIKLRMFTKAVILKVERGQELEEVLEEYTKLDEGEKEQLREAVKDAIESD